MKVIEVVNGVEIRCGEGGYDVQLTEDLEANITGFLERCVENGVTRLLPAIKRLRCNEKRAT